MGGLGRIDGLGHRRGQTVQSGDLHLLGAAKIPTSCSFRRRTSSIKPKARRPESASEITSSDVRKGPVSEEGNREGAADPHCRQRTDGRPVRAQRRQPEDRG